MHISPHPVFPILLTRVPRSVSSSSRLSDYLLCLSQVSGAISDSLLFLSQASGAISGILHCLLPIPPIHPFLSFLSVGRSLLSSEVPGGLPSHIHTREACICIWTCDPLQVPVCFGLWTSTQIGDPRERGPLFSQGAPGFPPVTTASSTISDWQWQGQYCCLCPRGAGF